MRTGPTVDDINPALPTYTCIYIYIYIHMHITLPEFLSFLYMGSLEGDAGFLSSTVGQQGNLVAKPHELRRVESPSGKYGLLRAVSDRCVLRSFLGEPSSPKASGPRVLRLMKATFMSTGFSSCALGAVSDTSAPPSRMAVSLAQVGSVDHVCPLRVPMFPLSKAGNGKGNPDRLPHQSSGFGSPASSLQQRWSATAVFHMLQHFLGSLVEAGFCHGVANCAAHDLDGASICESGPLETHSGCVWPWPRRQVCRRAAPKAVPDRKFQALSDNC